MGTKAVCSLWSVSAKILAKKTRLRQGMHGEVKWFPRFWSLLDEQSLCLGCVSADECSILYIQVMGLISTGNVVFLSSWIFCSPSTITPRP